MSNVITNRNDTLSFEQRINEEKVTVIDGADIKKARTSKRYSLREIASITGLSATFIGEIEKEKRFPSRKNLIKIANALEMDLNLYVVKLLQERISKIDTEKERLKLLQALAPSISQLAQKSN